MRGAGFDVTSGEETTFTQQYSTRLIQKGEQESNDDLIVHFVERITVTAEGEVLSDVKGERVECK